MSSPHITLPSFGAPMAEWARFYIALGWPVFPCKGKEPFFKSPHKKGDPLYGKCKGACGRLGHGFYDATLDTTLTDVWFWEKDLQIATPTGRAWWVLDIDPRNGGDDTLRDLEQTYHPLPRTTLCHSGGGGEHHYWQNPAVPLAPGAIQLGPGLDVQKEGKYIILPPSLHATTGQPYVWEPDYSPDVCPPHQAPEWLLALVTQADHTRTTRQARDDRDPFEPILEGSRESTLMSMAGALQRQGSSSLAIRAALEAENTLRCTPPLEPEDLDRMTASVGRYAPAPQLIITSNGRAAPPGWHNNAEPKPNWSGELFRKKDGETRQNYFNVTHILTHHEHWRLPERSLWYDAVRQKHMCGDTPITKPLLVQIAKWFGGQQDIRLPLTNLDLLRDCLYEQCELCPRDPLAIWVNSLPPWDQKPRLDTWLQQIAEAKDCAYSCDVSRVLPVGMIARALTPGCQYRYVVILQGLENTGKSALVRTLASPEWYYAMKNDFESKEAHMEIQGAWVAELPELDSLSRTGETRLKAFITLLDDSWIPKYANDRTTAKRRTVFVGTTNEETFLKSITGNTRFLPLTTGKIYLEQLEAMREQLFAEARHYYEQHPDDWWLFSEEGQATLELERDVRRVTTPYEDLLRDWLLTPLQGTYPPQIRHTTTWQEIASEVLGMPTPEHWKDKNVQMDISRAMRALGWVHSKRSISRGAPARWVWDSPEEWGVPF